MTAAAASYGHTATDADDADKNSKTGPMRQIGATQLYDCLLWLIRHTDLTPMIIGETGIGKSAIVSQVGAQYWKEHQAKNCMFAPDHQPGPDERLPPPLMTSEGVFDLRLPLMSEPADFLGIPYRVQRGPFSFTAHALPEEFPLWHTYHYVLFLDELNRAPSDILQGVLQLILDRRLHTQAIPVGTKFIAAGNPPGGAYHVEELDEALAARMVFFSYAADFGDFLNYAVGKMHPKVTQYLEAHRNELVEEAKPPVLTTTACPRKWDMVSDILLAWDPNEPACSLDNLGYIIGGLIGDLRGRSFAKFYYEGGAVAVDANEIFSAPSFPEDALKAQAGHAERTFYTVFTSIRWWERAEADGVTPANIRALDRLVELLPKDSAYRIVFDLAAPDKREQPGYQALSKTKKAKAIFTEIARDRRDYAI